MTALIITKDGLECYIHDLPTAAYVSGYYERATKSDIIHNEPLLTEVPDPQSIVWFKRTYRMVSHRSSTPVFKEL